MNGTLDSLTGDGIATSRPAWANDPRQASAGGSLSSGGVHSGHEAVVAVNAPSR